MTTYHTYDNVSTPYADIELQEAALRKALAMKDAEIQQLISNAREMQAEIDRLEREAREERYAKETAYQNGEMW